MGEVRTVGIILGLAQEKKIPLAGPLYRYYVAKYFGQGHYGVVVELEDEQIRMELKDGSKVLIAVTPETQRWTQLDIAVGDYLVVGGDKDDGIITAFGIKEVPQDKYLLFGRGKMYLPKGVK